MSYIFRKYFVVKRIRRVRRVRRQVKKSVKSKKEYVERKEEARKLVNEKLGYWKTKYLENFGLDLSYNKVAIKNTTTRFGSCSSKKNLNFSYKILDLTEEEQNYLVVHELCHLAEMNHGENFWHLVSLTIPNYKQIRDKMRKYSLG